MILKPLIAAACMTAFAGVPLALAQNAAPAAPAAPAPEPGPAIGVTTEPCSGVPIEPTAAQRASADWYGNWMHAWLSLDWGQLCRYRQENSALPPATSHRVVFIGDSITEGWKSLDPDFFHDDVLDRGISGQTTAQMLVRMRADVLDLHPAVVQIMAGTNDIAGNTGPTSLAIIQGNIASLAEQARSHGARVIIASIPPAARFPWSPAMQPVPAIKAMNDWLHDYAAREHFVYADYHAALDDGQGGIRPACSEDGVHPNAAGYAAMRPVAAAAIRSALAAPRR